MQHCSSHSQHGTSSTAPHLPQHVVQLGNNGLPRFLDDEDRRRYLQLLREILLQAGCLLQAYILKDDHFHLLATLPAIGTVAYVMQKTWLLLCQSAKCKVRTHRHFTESRHKSCLADGEKPCALLPSILSRRKVYAYCDQLMTP
jgi:putative transposase